MARPHHYDGDMKPTLSRWLAILAVACGFMAASLGGYLIYWQHTRPLGDAAIRQKFDCNRAATDARPTDVYCEYPAVYRSHAKHHTVIGANRPATDRTFVLTLVDGTTKRVVSQTPVKITSNNGVVCVQTACNTNAKTWLGTTDADGSIFVPFADIQMINLLTAGHYPTQRIYTANGGTVYVIILRRG